MTGPANISKVDRLRAKHGDLCWLCFKPIDFSPKARKTRRPTLEHLHPRSLGGSSELENLRLCHPGCNRQLADRPRSEKERMRARRMRKAEGKTEIRESAEPAQTSANSGRLVHKQGAGPSDLRLALLLAIASATFFAGLALGLLLAG